MEIHYQVLLGRKKASSNKNEFTDLAKEFREMNGYKDTKKLANECEDKVLMIPYNNLVQAKNKASTEKEFQDIANQFRAMNGYKNTKELANDCDNQFNILKHRREKQEINDQYNCLVNEANNASTIEKFQHLAKQFRFMNGYENTEEWAIHCDNKCHELKEQDKYNKLVKTKNMASTEDEFQGLAKQFREMNYENSEELAKECDNQYRLLKERREKKERNKKIRKKVIVSCIVGTVIVLIVGFFNGWFNYIDYKNRKEFSEGLAAVEFGNIISRKWGFIDKTGKEVIPFIYSDVLSFSEGLAAVRIGNDENGKWGFIDINGNEIIPFEYDLVQSFSEGYAKVGVKKNSTFQNFGIHSTIEWGLIDKNGNLIVQCKYGKIDNFIGDLAIINAAFTWRRKGGSFVGSDKLGVINKNGKEIITPVYRSVSIRDNEIEVKTEKNEIKYYDKSGKILKSNSDGLAAVEQQRQHEELSFTKELSPSEIGEFASPKETEGTYGFVADPNGKYYHFPSFVSKGNSQWDVFLYEEEFTASSVLAPQGNFRYVTDNLRNDKRWGGDRSVTWCEGVKGYGIGERINMRIKTLAKLKNNEKSLHFKALMIVNGYAKNETAWKNNSRVKILRLYVGSSHWCDLYLEDINKPQIFSFPKHLHIYPAKSGKSTSKEVESSSTTYQTDLIFEIIEVYPGSRFDDTCITGIALDVGW